MYVDIEKPQNHLRFGAKVLKFDTYMHVYVQKPPNHLRFWSECPKIHYIYTYMSISRNHQSTIDSAACEQKFTIICMYANPEKPPNNLNFGEKTLKFDTNMHINMEKLPNCHNSDASVLKLDSYFHVCQYRNSWNSPPPCMYVYMPKRPNHLCFGTGLIFWFWIHCQRV